MRLSIRAEGAPRRTIRSPTNGRIYEFRENARTVDVQDEADVGYILAVHGDCIQPEHPTADGWLVYNGDEPEVTLDLVAGPVTLPRGVVKRVEYMQQFEAERRKHWPPAVPTLTYEAGMRRLLVTRDMGLGDMLMLCAALRALKAQCPDIEITLATSGGWTGLLSDQPGLAGVVQLEHDVNGPAYDQHLMLIEWVEMADSRFTKHRVDVFAERLGIDEVADKSVVVPLTETERGAAAEDLNGAGRPLVGVAYRGSTNARSYPKDMIPGLCHELVGRGMGVALIDHAPQPDVELPAGALRLCAQHNARELAGVVSAMDCVVSTDSGLVHLAAAVGTPVVGIASGIPPELRWSGYDNVHVVDTVERYGCDYCHDGPSCRPGDVGSESLTDWAPPCLRSLPPDELADIVAEVVA